jgi:ATP-dependent RNA helicase RhlE
VEQLRGNSLAAAALVIGGVPEKRQLDILRSGARVLVATPARLEDFLRRKLVDLRQVEVLILDEADRMLDMGFLPASRRIVAGLPMRRQPMCFSATLETSVAGLVNDYTRDPIRIALGSNAETSRQRRTARVRSRGRRQVPRPHPSAPFRKGAYTSVRPYQARHRASGEAPGA